MRGRLLLIAALAGVSLAGCAAGLRSGRHSVAGFRITRRDILSVRVDAPPGVKILPRDEQRMARVISRDIRTLQKADPVVGSWRAYEIAVRITRYAAGGEFVRTALFERSRVCMAGTVQVFSLPQHRLEATFALSKVFTRDSLYGTSDSLRDAERVFARHIAQALTGLGRGESAHSALRCMPVPARAGHGGMSSADTTSAVRGADGR